ncbi:pyridoxamine 5'-phosphate oxidase family protein [Halovenus salina]|uniref:Pyridoxamine 5'-phosphate oxidase family protein n=1 Tax=Halovenus salina TaxID=1510225 RepID=A0ABD5W0T0_9EURY|nr:pyridoxamine 5'-phosphate oxidase family protein [Halovenus salina]
MEVVENTLDTALDSFLDRPLFCFLGQVADGEPRISPLWYLWEDERVWIIGDTVGKSYMKRVERNSETAVAIVDFDVTTGRVEHVGMRGHATVSSLTDNRVFRLLRRYLGEEPAEWDPRFAELDGERWSFIEFTPDTVVARDQSFAPSRNQ